MPIATCDEVARGLPYNEVAEEREGVAYVFRWTWDRTSAWPNCDGPIIYMRVKNTNSSPRWVLLPNKRAGSSWQQIPAGYENVWDTTLPGGAGNQAQNELRSLNIDSYVDVKNPSITATAP